METITRAKRFISDSKDIRFYIETVDETGKAHNYTRYLTGNTWHAAKSWGTDKLWNGQEEGEPSAEVEAEYRRLTNGGRKSYKREQPITRMINSDDNIENDVIDAVRPIRHNDDEMSVTA